MYSTEPLTSSRRLPQGVNVAHTVETLARRIPHAIAIASAGRLSLTYSRLASQISNVALTLKAIGIGGNDRVAIVLPNGPEMTVALLAIFRCATAAPLNPTYSAREVDFFFSDLNVKALIVQSGSVSPARTVAQRRGISILELSTNSETDGGIFELCTGKQRSTLDVGEARSSRSDVALVLHTSGTTSRAKIVPLTHANILASAANMMRTLLLTEKDRYLNVMPLFHIHGLMATVASLLAGGCVCSERFDPQRFFQCMDEFNPTWYTAVPTMHQAILRLACGNQETIGRSRLRFIRSCSAPLPTGVMKELETIFHVPVIEAYGMTEASHQIASNPLPPGNRKPASVGFPEGLKIAIMDQTGTLIPLGQTGEVVIQGMNVFAGYENNGTANAEAFKNGWFRTGDEGFLDSEGYLFLTGRLKDIVNRGGEKISPSEIDAILLTHPAIEQAVVFPVPHPSLDEDIVAAVVLRRNAVVTEKEIREFVGERLAAFKVPQRIVILEDIPRGSTGKLKRRVLAEKLGFLTSNGTRRRPVAYVAPDRTVEHQLVQIWEEFLPVRPIGLQDSFFELGGDSLLAAQMMQRVEQILGKKLPLATLFSGPTIAHLATALLKHRLENDEPLLVTIQSGGSRHPFFFLHWDFAGGGFYCLNLARCLGEDQSFYVLAPHAVMNKEAIPSTYEAMAASYIEMIRAIAPEGPYVLGGMCSGAVVAFEMARQLERKGQKVPLVVLVSPAAWNSPRMRYLQDFAAGISCLLGLGDEKKMDFFLRMRHPWFRVRYLYFHCIRLLVELGRLERREQLRSAFRLAKRIALTTRRRVLQIFRKKDVSTSINRAPANQPVQRDPHTEIYFRARAAYVRRCYSGKVALFWPVDEPFAIEDEPPLTLDKMHDKTLGWRQVVRDLEVHEVPDTVYPLVTKHVRVLAERIRACLDRVQGSV